MKGLWCSQWLWSQLWSALSLVQFFIIFLVFPLVLILYQFPLSYSFSILSFFTCFFFTSLYLIFSSSSLFFSFYIFLVQQNTLLFFFFLLTLLNSYLLIDLYLFPFLPHPLSTYFISFSFFLSSLFSFSVNFLSFSFFISIFYQISFSHTSFISHSIQQTVTFLFIPLLNQFHLIFHFFSALCNMSSLLLSVLTFSSFSVILLSFLFLLQLFLFSPFWLFIPKNFLYFSPLFNLSVWKKFSLSFHLTKFIFLYSSLYQPYFTNQL